MLTHNVIFYSQIPTSDSETSSSIPYDAYLEGDVAQLNDIEESDVADENGNEDKESEEDDITVAALPEHEKKDRKRGTRMNWCKYCDKVQTHLARHLLVKHAQEDDVVQAFLYPPKNAQRKLLLKIICDAGNMKHNQEVLQSRKGVLKPARRVRGEMKMDELLPCTGCNKLICRRVLARHRKKCSQLKESERKASQRNAATTAAVLMHCPRDVSDSFRKNVLVGMRPDDAYLAITRNNLILRYGTLLFEECEENERQVPCVRNNIREAGRLFHEAACIDSTLLRFEQLLTTQKFDVLCEAVKRVARMHEPDSKKSSTTNKKKSAANTALKMGNHVEKMANIMLADALMASSRYQRDEIFNFLELKKIRWASEIQKKARRQIAMSKTNKVLLLPTVEDIKLLTDYLVAGIKSSMEKIENGEGNQSDWIRMAKLLLVRITIFNRKRSSEVASLELGEYSKKIEHGGVNSEVSKALTATEKFMVDTMTRLETVGKRFRPVPVLLTRDMVNAIDVLIATRETIGQTNSNNKYVFAMPLGNGKSFIQGCAATREAANKCGAEHPERLRATRLRHHIATTSQLFNMGKYELDQLATFMGHTLEVHRKFYRLQDSSMQIAKVSLILTALDHGMAEKFTGKKLDEINFTEAEELVQETLARTAPEMQEDELEQDDDNSLNNEEQLEPTVPCESAETSGQGNKQKNKPKKGWCIIIFETFIVFSQ